MSVTLDAEIFDAETGLYVQIVRDAETGEIVGKNERAAQADPEPENPAKASARAKLAALGLTEDEITAMVGA
jgi:hypothetical protein